jgi:hypothetical protein
VPALTSSNLGEPCRLGLPARLNQCPVPLDEAAVAPPVNICPTSLSKVLRCGKIVAQTKAFVAKYIKKWYTASIPSQAN